MMAMAALKEKLEKDCLDGEGGLMNPAKALDILNELQRKDCPEAYEPEIVMANRLKKEAMIEQEEFWKQMDKTLFDFDDDVDHLSEVSERYKLQKEKSSPTKKTVPETTLDAQKQPLQKVPTRTKSQINERRVSRLRAATK